MRNYLNSSFYQSAFDENEKKKIISAYLSDPNGTKDNVFVLSKSEADNLMTQNERTYGNKEGCNGHNCSDCYQYSHQHGTCWWLRSPNGNNIHVVGVDGGSVYTNAASHLYSIRPAMYVKE